MPLSTSNTSLEYKTLPRVPSGLISCRLRSRKPSNMDTFEKARMSSLKIMLPWHTCGVEKPRHIHHEAAAVRDRIRLLASCRLCSRPGETRPLLPGVEWHQPRTQMLLSGHSQNRYRASRRPGFRRHPPPGLSHSAPPPSPPEEGGAVRGPQDRSTPYVRSLNRTCHACS